MPATNEQIQQFVNERIRPLCEKIRETIIFAQDNKVSIEDIYVALQPENNPTFTDNRQDAPPHLMTPSDVLAVHSFEFDLVDFALNHSAWPVVQRSCVRPVHQ